MAKKGSDEMNIEAEKNSLIYLERDGKWVSIDVVDGVLDLQGDMPVSDAARQLFELLAFFVHSSPLFGTAQTLNKGVVVFERDAYDVSSLAAFQSGA